MRIRVRFTKLGKVRWIGHRDVARVWERALRRAELPVARSEGFSPRPKVSFGLALSTGHESIGEYLDVELDESAPWPVPELGVVPARLSASLPAGMDVTAIRLVEAGEPSLQQDVIACRWDIEISAISVEQAETAVGAALGSESIIATRTRKGNEVVDDIRPALLLAQVLRPGQRAPGGDDRADEGVAVRAELATHPRSLRPSEFIAAVFPGAQECRVLRTHQWIERDGARREPIPAEATDARHAYERAS